MHLQFICRNECCVWGGCAAAVQCLSSGFPPVTGWNNVLLFIFYDIYSIPQALLNTSPPGWTVGRERLIPLSCWGREGGFPAFAVFPVLLVAARQVPADWRVWLWICWAPHSCRVFFLWQLSGESSHRPVGLVQGKKYFATFLALS